MKDETKIGAGLMFKDGVFKGGVCTAGCAS
jgi:hypothetical protein